MQPVAEQRTPPTGASAILDLESLLTPIPGDAPCGRDLREDGSPSAVYHRLRDLRSNARNNERTARANGDTDYLCAGDWLPIVEQAPLVLAEQSKDLEITAWLIEALTRVHGFAGAAAGFSLARELIARFGEALHPRPDEDGKATQLSALVGLNGFGSEGALISPLKSIPLTEGAPPAPFAAWQCEQAFELERIGDPAKREARVRQGFAQRAELDQAVSETSQAFLQESERQLQAALTEYQQFQDTLDRYCDSDPQPTARIHDTLSGCLQTLTYLAGERLRAAADVAAEESAAAPDEVAADAASPAPAASLDRERALRQLAEVASFFRRTEPHSPVSYAIEQAVYWSRLSLPQLLGELIPDDGARQRFHQLAGIRSSEK